jgi:RNA-binding motif X-linked protein 2
MNTIRQIQNLNKRELEEGITPEGSWHADYRDTAYIYIGGLPFELSEGDVITIFSQFGEPVFINLVRDKETCKSKGFAFLKYEDQRSTDLAVDNLGGATIMGRVLRVDHTRYKRKDDEEEADNTLGNENLEEDEESSRKKRRTESDSEEERPLLKEEKELAELIRTHDNDDPMKAYLVEQKREEVEAALKKLKKSKKDGKHKHHRSKRHRDTSEDREREKRIKSGLEDRRKHRSSSPRDARESTHRRRSTEPKESARRHDRDRSDSRDRRKQKYSSVSDSGDDWRRRPRNYSPSDERERRRDRSRSRDRYYRR